MLTLLSNQAQLCTHMQYSSIWCGRTLRYALAALCGSENGRHAARSAASCDELTSKLAAPTGSIWKYK